MYAVIDDKGKQYKVSEGQDLLVDLMPAAAGEVVEFDNVLLVGGQEGEAPRIGHPQVDGAKVLAEVVRHEKGVKVITLRYQGPHQTKKGHRQKYTRLIVREIRPG